MVAGFLHYPSRPAFFVSSKENKIGGNKVETRLQNFFTIHLRMDTDRLVLSCQSSTCYLKGGMGLNRRRKGTIDLTRSQRKSDKVSFKSCQMHDLRKNAKINSARSAKRVPAPCCNDKTTTKYLHLVY